MIYLILTILFYIPYTALHGFISKQLLCMRYLGAVGEIKGKEYKGKWHIAGAITRAVFHGSILVMDLNYGIISIALSVLLYDSLIDIWRGKFRLKFTGTCEGTWDMDCFWLKCPVNHLIVKSIILIIAYYLLG